MQELIAQANADSFARRWAKGCSFDFMWRIGEKGYLISVKEGEIASITAADRRLSSWDFAVSGPTKAWEAHWAPLPEPTFHDIIAMRTAGHITIEGNLQPFFASILYIKRLLELPREQRSAA